MSSAIMNEIPSGSEQNEERQVSKGIILAFGLALIFLSSLLGYWLGTRQNMVPPESSGDVGFIRDMMTHHAQAVDLATIIRESSDDELLRQIALDIMLTQQGQIGQMQGWLSIWGHPVASTEPAMAWMGMPTNGLMPGMATPEEINYLRSLSGTQADGEFLRLMIIHHNAGVAMAEAVLERGDQAAVRALAQSIANAQMSEIDLMQSLLEQKGFPRVIVEEILNDTTMDH